MADQLGFPVFFLLLLLGVAFRPSTCEPEPHTSVIRLPEGISDEGSSVPSERVRPSFSCPVTCFTTNPVCGADGVTYWCGPADAFCSGTEVAKLGFCDVGSGGNGAFPGQAFLLIHIVWLIVLGFHFLLGFF
ncbi:uncharacterized protein LOC116261092 [Nymphaea colorata]|uniref:uncharacterized protein LOC116261092 n=1 Tax=Nymphaea colorata TaxID=210225 RepID=UPI00129D9173|nr:uncharacterized protein LOC116261092 [Nymphaea colorata]